MFTWPTPLKYPESEPSTPLTPLKYPESMSKYTEAIAEVYLLSSECNFNAMLTRREASTPSDSRDVLASLQVNIAAESVVYLAWTRGT